MTRTAYRYSEVTYAKHTAVKFYAAFRDSQTGVLTNPGALSVDVLAPDGSITTYTAVGSGELDLPVTAALDADTAEALGVTDAENASPYTGIAVLEIVLDQERLWRIRWQASSGLTVAGEQEAFVARTPFA